MYSLCVCVCLVRGVPQDVEKAAAMYRQASQYQNSAAMFNLACMHQFGIGLPQDLHLAKRCVA
jgi:SEL1 protein